MNTAIVSRVESAFRERVLQHVALKFGFVRFKSVRVTDIEKILKQVSTGIRYGILRKSSAAFGTSKRANRFGSTLRGRLSLGPTKPILTTRAQSEAFDSADSSETLAADHVGPATVFFPLRVSIRLFVSLGRF